MLLYYTILYYTTLHYNISLVLDEGGRGAGEGLLEEVQGVVVVQDLDGVGERDELIGARLLDDVELGLAVLLLLLLLMLLLLVC